MMYKLGGKYYILKEKTEDGFMFQDIASGDDKFVTGPNNAIDDFKVDVTEALYDFFDAQWVGNPDLEKMTMAMMQEVSEAFNELDWKPWKSKEVNLKLYREELADVGIFLLLCSKTAGMSLDDLFMEMMKKHLFNLTRLDHDRKRLADKK